MRGQCVWEAGITWGSAEQIHISSPLNEAALGDCDLGSFQRGFLGMQVTHLVKLALL